MAEQTTTRIYMIRHGATQLSAEDRFAGAVDVALSEDGKLQAARLAERLSDDSITAIYCSPLPLVLQLAKLSYLPDTHVRVVDNIGSLEVGRLVIGKSVSLNITRRLYTSANRCRGLS